MRRAFLLLPCLLTLAAATAPGAPPDPHTKPKLVLAIVIDQFRYDYLLRFRADYTSGLARLLDQGAVFTDAHYRHAATVTAVGHSTFLSGATPSISGIVNNEWYDRAVGRTVTSVSDESTQLIGGPAVTTGSSPRRLLVTTVGDELKMREGDSRVVSVSIKDRSAVLPGGRLADGAYWFGADSNTWVTSTYYRQDLPAWAAQVNASRPAQRALGATWYPVDQGQSGKPFCTMVNGSEVRYCNSLEATPWGNEIIEEFAEAALRGEALGKHSSPDILAVSFSSNDYVGHAVGPDSPAVRDMAIRTDRLLGKLIQAAESAAGAGNLLVALTADHGVAPVPELRQGRVGGRLDAAHLKGRITDALTKRFGAGNWILAGSAEMPYLNLELIQRNKLDRAEVERVAAEAARAEPHVARVYTRSQILSGEVQHDAIGEAVSLGFRAERSGDLIIVQEPFYLFGATGTSHGTPYNYDNHVPVVFFGTGIKPGVYSRRVAVNDIAPTLAALLGVEQPCGSVGRVLTEALR